MLPAGLRLKPEEIDLCVRVAQLRRTIEADESPKAAVTYLCRAIEDELFKKWRLK